MEVKHKYLQIFSFITPQNERCIYKDICQWVFFKAYTIKENKKRDNTIFENIDHETLSLFSRQQIHISGYI